METNGVDEGPNAKARLAELDAAVSSTRIAGFPPTPLWYWLVLALAGPLAVAFETGTGIGRLFAIVGALVVPAVVGAHDWRRRQVRPIRSHRSFTQMRASFSLAFAMCFTLLLIEPAVSVAPSTLVALVAYGWLAVALTVLGRRVERTVLADEAIVSSVV